MFSHVWIRINNCEMRVFSSPAVVLAAHPVEEQLAAEAEAHFGVRDPAHGLRQLLRGRGHGRSSSGRERIVVHHSSFEQASASRFDTACKNVLSIRVRNIHFLRLRMKEEISIL